MSRIEPRRREDVPELESFFSAYEDRMGFLPNSMLVMANRPGLVEALTGLAKVIYDRNGKTSIQLRNMVGHIASRSAGCMYCSAHAANNAARSEIDDEKIAALWEFESSPLFSDAERAALRFAVAAASIPNGVTDELVEDLERYYDTQQMVEIMAIIAWFGFLNRWNDSLATQLEDKPRSTAERTVMASGWTAGKHAT